MRITLADAEIELAKAKERQKNLNAALQSLQAENAEATGLVGSWQTIVNALRKSNNANDALVPDPQAQSAPKPEAQSDIPVNEYEEDGENKTQFVREQIKANQRIGISPAGLKRAAMVAKMTYPPSWPYGPLQRLKKRGEIVKRGGRFYPADSATQNNLTLVG